MVHPRVGGEARCSSRPRSQGRGPSPRGRGSPRPGRCRTRAQGSIPAWAGKPCDCRWPAGSCRVHPRVGGEAEGVVPNSMSESGPSPRGRGSLAVEVSDPGKLGSIPAWAGKPGTRSRPRPCGRVHPRVGGEARSHSADRHAGHGPSPRGRGSLVDELDRVLGSGSIPAWAGKPPPVRRCPRRRWVHPRVGGEADVLLRHPMALWGPSPRGRGSPNRTEADDLRLRSIPAWAGKPSPGSSRRSGRRVHPRVGGEASVRVRLQAHGLGPSPRGRGSHRRRLGILAGDGSIPAWAGSPLAVLATVRVRGSIPAWAGKPWSPRVSRLM